MKPDSCTFLRLPPRSSMVRSQISSLLALLHGTKRAKIFQTRFEARRNTFSNIFLISQGAWKSPLHRTLLFFWFRGHLWCAGDKDVCLWNINKQVSLYPLHTRIRCGLKDFKVHAFAQFEHRNLSLSAKEVSSCWAMTLRQSLFKVSSMLRTCLEYERVSVTNSGLAFWRTPLRSRDKLRTRQRCFRVKKTFLDSS